MPPHLSQPAPIEIEIQAGETSAIQTLEIWNDKTAEFLDTTTAENIAIPLLASQSGGPFVDRGWPVLDERWARAKVAKYLSTPDEGNTFVETTDGTTGSGPWGANAILFVNDLPPQHGVRIEFEVHAPGGRGLFAFRIGISILDGQTSAPLAPLTSIATGSGVIPPDRLPNTRALMDGAEVTADDTDTVTIAAGHLVFDQTTVTFLESEVTFDLEDGDAVDLGTGEGYRVTLSKDADGADVVTKGLKAEAILWPDVPADTVFVKNLIVASADGVNVTVAPASLTGEPAYVGYHARIGTGLTVLLSRGEAINELDFHDRQSHEIPVAVTASATNRVWVMTGGQATATTTDTPPELGAQLVWYAVTGVATVTALTDARRFAHRALVEWWPDIRHVAVLSEESAGEAVAPLDDWIILYDELGAELEAVELNLSDTDGLWTAGAIKVDVLTVGPGEALAAGTTIFTDSATDDRRPSIAFDATVLRSITRLHQVRRFPGGTRFMVRIVETVTASAPEPDHEIRVALHFRRYR